MAKLAVVSLLTLFHLVNSFSTQSYTGGHRRTSRAFLVKGDFPPDDNEYAGEVDWDAEWKKVVANDGKLDGGAQRPGKDFYKSEAEIAAIKATNQAADKVRETSVNVSNVIPDIRSLSGDWKVRYSLHSRICCLFSKIIFLFHQFWIAILAVISVGLSLLTAPPAEVVGQETSSYYI